MRNLLLMWAGWQRWVEKAPFPQAPAFVCWFFKGFNHKDMMSRSLAWEESRSLNQLCWGVCSPFTAKWLQQQQGSQTPQTEVHWEHWTYILNPRVWQEKVLTHPCPFLQKKCMPGCRALSILIKGQQLSKLPFLFRCCLWHFPLCCRNNYGKDV